MEEPLFSISKKDDGMMIAVNVSDDRDAFGVALSLFQLLMLDRTPVSAHFLFILDTYRKDPEFRKKLDEATVELPDFNQILHDNGSK